MSAMIVLNGCLGTEDPPVDPQLEQFTKDVAAIDAYLETNGISAITDDFTGIRYVVNEEGDGLKPYLSVIDSLTLTYEASVLNTGVVFQEATNEKSNIFTLLPGIAYAASFIQEGGSVTAYAPSFYGLATGTTDDVPANSILKLDVELDKVIDRQLTTEINIIDDTLDLGGKVATIDPSGIRYMLDQGGGNFPNDNSVVTVNYKGWVLNSGVVFDQGTGVTFALSNLILGWQIMLPKMKEGGVMTMYIPSPYAYGTGGSGGSIPPNATLVFEMELISIN